MISQDRRRYPYFQAMFASWKALPSHSREKMIRETSCGVGGCGLSQTFTVCKGISLWGFLWSVLQGYLPSFLQSLGLGLPLFACSTSAPGALSALVIHDWSTFWPCWPKFDLKATLCLRNTNNRCHKLTGKVDYRRFCPVVPNCWDDTIRFKQKLLNLPFASISAAWLEATSEGKVVNR